MAHLGTPYQAGEEIRDQLTNKLEMVEGYDWDNQKGLIVITDQHRYSDYDIANEYRRFKIKQYQQELKNRCNKQAQGQ